MRKIIVSNLITLDGFFEGPRQELDWFVVEEEFFEYVKELFKSVDAILYGRVTFLQMASYWPTPASDKNDPVITGGMNSMQKIVFSTTLTDRDVATTGWNNSTLINKNIVEEVKKMKQEAGKDMVIFGSGKLINSFAAEGLIDEYRLILNPVILGKGNPLFKPGSERKDLKLLSTRTLGSGVVILVYATK